MNCWGFTAAVLPALRTSFLSFLEKLQAEDETVRQKKECYLPNSVEEMIRQGIARVQVYPTDAVWYGVTYHEDKETVKNAMASLVRNGVYPDALWS